MEDYVQKIAKSLFDFHDAACEARLHVTHPELFMRLEEVRKSLQSQCDVGRTQQVTCSDAATTTEGIRTATTEASAVMRSGQKAISRNLTPSEGLIPETTVSLRPTISGDVVNTSYGLHHEPESGGFPSLKLYKLTIGRNIESSVRASYSFQEASFSRRLHRYSLEYAFQLFCDPRSDPTTVYRTFRLVPCVQNKKKMYPYFKKLVQSDRDDPLEIASLPFYCIGGAGRHYPPSGEDGKPIYPLNTRLPGRIIGLRPASRPESDDKIEPSRQRILQTLCLDGDWLDCKDVEGYLRSKGGIANTSDAQHDTNQVTHGM